MIWYFAADGKFVAVVFYFFGSGLLLCSRWSAGCSLRRGQGYCPGAGDFASAGILGASHLLEWKRLKRRYPDACVRQSPLLSGGGIPNCVSGRQYAVRIYHVFLAGDAVLIRPSDLVKPKNLAAAAGYIVRRGLSFPMVLFIFCFISIKIVFDFDLLKTSKP